MAKKRQNVSSYSDLSPSHAKWLLKDDGKRVSASEGLKPSATSVSTENNTPWLKSPLTTWRSSNQHINTSPDRARFSHSSDTNLWLLKPRDSTEMADTVTSDSTLTSEPMVTFDLTDQMGDVPWLLKSLHITSSGSSSEASVEVNKSTDFNNSVSEDEKGDGLWLMKGTESSLFKESSTVDTGLTTDLSDWLLVPQKRSNMSNSQEDVNSAEIEAVSCCDSWSVCSTPHSLSADQHAHDVEVAHDYYNKWLLCEDHK